MDTLLELDRLHTNYEGPGKENKKENPVQVHQGLSLGLILKLLGEAASCPEGVRSVRSGRLLRLC